MSKFLEKMTARSLRPEDFRKSVVPIRDVPSSGVPDLGVPESGVPPSATPEADAPNLGILRDRTPKPRPARTVQDAHTHAEQALYQAMYRDGVPIPGTDNRRITAGSRTLAERACMAHSTCQANLRSLIEKLAIQCEGQRAGHSDGKTYVVYSFAEILKRRQSAGLTHVLRATKGVRLVNPGVPGIGVPDLVPESNSGVPDFPNSGVPDFGTASKGITVQEIVEEPEPSSSLIQTAARFGLALDDDAARRIVQACREHEPSATTAEMAHFLTLKLDQLRGSGGIKNWPGMLIRSVPQYFVAPATQLRMLREAWR